jgi:hypothetical protein
MSNKKEYQVTDVAGKLAKGFLRSPLTAVLGIWHLKQCQEKKTLKLPFQVVV